MSEEIIISNISENTVKNVSEIVSETSNIDIENLQHIDALKCHDFEGLILNLNSSISFFEKGEEYEKCSHLFKIKKLIEESLQTT